MAIDIWETGEKKANDCFGVLNMVAILIFNIPDTPKLIYVLLLALYHKFMNHVSRLYAFILGSNSF